MKQSQKSPTSARKSTTSQTARLVQLIEETQINEKHFFPKKGVCLCVCVYAYSISTI